MKNMKWTEVNITPAGGNRDQFLAGVIAPCIRDRDLESWHFFWEPAEGWKPGKAIDDSKAVLRFRILSSDPADRKALLSALEKAKDRGAVRKWYEGAHGERGKKYEGEGQSYGDRAWEATRECWRAMSALTLELAVHAAQGDLELPRSYHWKRIAHLAANQMSLPDVRMNLEQGHRYLQVKRTLLDEKLTGPDREIMDALDRYLYQEDVI